MSLRSHYGEHMSDEQWGAFCDELLSHVFGLPLEIRLVGRRDHVLRCLEGLLTDQEFAVLWHRSAYGGESLEKVGKRLGVTRSVAQRIQAEGFRRLRGALMFARAVQDRTDEQGQSS